MINRFDLAIISMKNDASWFYSNEKEIRHLLEIGSTLMELKNTLKLNFNDNTSLGTFTVDSLHKYKAFSRYLDKSLNISLGTKYVINDDYKKHIENEVIDDEETT